MIVYSKDLKRKQKHILLDSVVCPRPIFFISTVSKDGLVNLAPYSFSMVISTDPPLVCFSPLTRFDGTEKDSLANSRETREFVVNMVTESIIDDVLICANFFPPDVSELPKTSLTAVPSLHVTPPRILESPVNMECKVVDIIKLGNSKLYHSLIIGEVIVFHINDDVYTGEDIDPFKLNIVGRMGKSYLLKATEIFSRTDIWNIELNLKKEKDD